MNLGHFLADIEFKSGGPNMSRIIASDHFVVNRVAAPKGTKIPPHPEPAGTFFFVLQGSGTFTADGELIDVSANHGVYVKAGGVRGLEVKEDMVFLGIQDKSTAAESC